MRFFSTLAIAASGLASMVAAQTASGPLYFTWMIPGQIKVGDTYNVTYAAATLGAPVEILLRKGASSDLKTVATLTSSATGGSYEWTVSTSLPNGGDYALQIKQGSDINYSKQFVVYGSTAVASSSASESSSITSSAASSSSTASSSSNSTVTTGSASSASTATRSGSATGSASTASRSASATTSAPQSAPTNAGSNIKSPLALIFGAVAAMAYLQ